MEGNKPNKPRRMIQVWMLANSYKQRPNNDLEEWRRHTFEPAIGGLAENRKKKSNDCKSFSSWNISSLRNCFVRQLIILVYCNRIVSNIFVGPMLSFKVTFSFVLKVGYNVAPLRKDFDPHARNPGSATVDMSSAYMYNCI